MEKFDEKLYLADMYKDNYYPGFLVDKIRILLKEAVEYLESGKHDLEDIQKVFDKAIVGINDLEEEFDENGSEIETVARESIGKTIRDIIKHFNLSIDDETLMRERDW